MDVLETRRALAEALSAHDADRVKPFLHPTYVVRGADGAVVLDCRTFVSQLPRFFHDHPEYRQTIELEQSTIAGDVATLTTRHIDLLRSWWRARPIPSLWDEVWHQINGRWMLVEERPHCEVPQALNPPQERRVAN